MEKSKKDVKARNVKEPLDEMEDTQHPVQAKASKKKEKKDKKKQVAESDEDEVEDEPVGKATVVRFSMLDVEDQSAGESNDSDSEVQQVQTKSSQKKAKKAVKVSQARAGDSSAKEAKENANVDKMTKKDKKGKASKKEKEADDIDAILEELSLQNNGTGNDKKDRKKKGQKNAPEEPAAEDSNQEAAAASAKSLTVENRLMTQDEIAKAMEEMYPSSEDEKKGKKKKKDNKKHKDSEKGKVQNEGKAGDVPDKANVGSQQNKKEMKEVVENGAIDESTAKLDSQKKKGQKTETKQPNKSGTGKEVIAEVKLSLSSKESTPEPSATKDILVPEADEGEANEDGSKKSKKDKKKKKVEKEKEKKEEIKKEKKPTQSKMAQMILEQQRLIREEEERRRKEEEDRIRMEEERERLREEKARLEKEKKDREKQKKKDRIDRLKAEGKYLTPEQKEKKRRALAMLEALKSQGAEIPTVPSSGAAVPTDGERKKTKVVYDNKKKKKQQTGVERQESDTTKEVTSPDEEAAKFPEVSLVDTVKDNETEVVAEPAAVEDESIKDAWDESSAEEEEDSIEVSQQETAKKESDEEQEEDDDDDDDDDDEDDTENSSSEEDSDSGSSEEEGDGKSLQEKAREKAVARIKARKDEAESRRSVEVLRAPVVCVLGHVDTGKTKILDKLRRTNVQDGEAGGITQQIGATNVPQDTIREQTRMCKEFTKVELKLPGLLIIDTPGHESFSNLRNRGSSLCDIAILVVDIMHGLEPQTRESIELLRQKKTPFVVALNKIDRLNEWQTSPHTDVVTTIGKQKQSTKLHFEDRVKRIVVEFAELGLNVALFHQNNDISEYISMVPTSAHSGDGMGNLIALICEHAQALLARRLMYSDDLQATVMEVKAIPGHGTTIDVILVNGIIREGETIIVAGQEGPIVTQIRALLMPQPLRELRVKSAFEHHKEVRAAQGCKIAAKDLEKALAGLPLFIAHHPDEVDIHRDELSQMLEDVLGSIKVQERGVFVQASTLGSLEALLVFLGASKIPYAGISIGPVHKRDVMRASVMLEHDPQNAVILAFDVKVERDAQEMADGLDVKIFCADIIYHLFDRFTKHREDWMHKKQEEFKNVAVFPCKLRIYPENVFKSRDPIVVGVNVEAGFLKEGTMLCVPSKEFLVVGRVSSIEVNHKQVQKAAKGQDVCIKIDPIPGEAPKMYGRHFDNTDLLVSKISRESIDVVKNYFREEMTKADWQLVLELKKTFAIL